MDYEEDIICPICCGKARSSTKTFVCSHVYCQICIVSWYRKCVDERKSITCPVCRKIDNKWGK